MTSKLSLPRIAGLLMIIGVCWLANAQDQRARRPIKPIHVSTLNRNKVIGSLQRALGEVINIEGLVADENYTRKKADTGELLLRVQAVNGKRLKREVILPFSPFPGADLKNPSVGSKFKYIGYETGGFSGTPEKAFDYLPRAATTGYYFRSSFVVLRDEKR